jgi:hypothetical protein
MMSATMKFDVAIKALGSVTWDWSERGFESILSSLGLTREADADAEMPNYLSPWGKEWVQAIVEDGAVDRLEVLVEDTSPRWRPFTMKKLEALARKYRDKLATYVKHAEAVLGPPTFYGELDEAGRPDDEDGYMLALWRRDTARLMLIARNEGPDTPFWISIVIKPLAARAPTARASRPAMRAPTRQSSVALGGARFDAALDKIASERWSWTEPNDAILDKLALPASRDGDRIELVVESTSPPSEGFTSEDHTDLYREYCEMHELYVERAQRILGKPKFNDGMSRKGYPKDEPGVLLALWPLKTARVMLLFRAGGPDGETPYSLSVVIKPR